MFTKTRKTIQIATTIFLTCSLILISVFMPLSKAYALSGRSSITIDTISDIEDPILISPGPRLTHYKFTFSNGAVLEFTTDETGDVWRGGILTKKDGTKVARSVNSIRWVSNGFDPTTKEARKPGPKYYPVSASYHFPKNVSFSAPFYKWESANGKGIIIDSNGVAPYIVTAIDLYKDFEDFNLAGKKNTKIIDVRAEITEWKEGGSALNSNVLGSDGLYADGGSPKMAISKNDPWATNFSGLAKGFGMMVGTCAASLLATSFSRWLLTKLGTIFSLERVFSVPVIDPVQQGKEVGSLVMPSMDGLANCLVSAVIVGMIRSTTAWVKGGFYGNPMFVDNPSQFFQDSNDYIVSRFLTNDPLINNLFCKPWSINIKLALLRREGVNSRGGCTLSDMKNNIKDFVGGNFKKGGWKTWFDLTKSNGNNKFGAYDNAVFALDSELAENNHTISMELDWAGGFLADKEDCTENTASKAGADYPKTVTRANCKTITPGMVTASGLSKAVGLGLDRAVIADEFDELINVVINKVINTLYTGFLSGDWSEGEDSVNNIKDSFSL